MWCRVARRFFVFLGSVRLRYRKIVLITNCSLLTTLQDGIPHIRTAPQYGAAYARTDTTILSCLLKPHRSVLSFVDCTPFFNFFFGVMVASCFLFVCFVVVLCGSLSSGFVVVA
jgi:hypothetical protein